MPASSSSLARSVGGYSPVRLLWLMVREVEKPKGAGLNRVPSDLAHLGDIGLSSLFVADCASPIT